jgi:hypothetical protein
MTTHFVAVVSLFFLFGFSGIAHSETMDVTETKDCPYICLESIREKNVEKDGCMGFFEFSSKEKSALEENNAVTIWREKVDTSPNSGCLFGEITEETVVMIPNEDNMNKDLLRYINGEYVLAYGEYAVIGEGEGSRQIIKKLVLFLLK